MPELTSSIIDRYGFKLENGVLTTRIYGDNYTLELFLNGDDLTIEYTDFDNGEIFNPESASIHMSDLSEEDYEKIEKNFDEYAQRYDLMSTWNNGKVLIERFLKNFECFIQYPHEHTYKTVAFTIRQANARDLNNIFENTTAIIRVMSYFL